MLLIEPTEICRLVGYSNKVYKIFMYISLSNQVSQLGVGIRWNPWPLSVDHHGHHDGHWEHVLEGKLPVRHLVQHHAKAVDVGWKLVTLVIQDLWSRPMHGTNIAWGRGGLMSAVPHPHTCTCTNTMHTHAYTHTHTHTHTHRVHAHTPTYTHIPMHVHTHTPHTPPPYTHPHSPTSHSGRLLSHPGQPKVAELGLAGRGTGEQHVLALEVPMEDVDGVKILEASTDVCPQLSQVGEGEVDLVDVDQLGE